MPEETRYPWETRRLRVPYDVIAPDTSEIRVLAQSTRGSMAHVTLAAGAVSVAIRHATVEEVWLILSGTGEFWRRLGELDQVIPLEPGLSLSIPVGVEFQFRATGAEPLTAVLVTMPPWPGPDEAIVVSGRWEPRAV